MEKFSAESDKPESKFSESKLLEKRILFISEAINAKVAKSVINTLLLLDAENQNPIRLFMNSPGGEVNSGFAIFDMIRFIESDVHIINTGLCASIATVINLAAKKEHRYGMPNARFMIHQPLIGGYVQGQASDLEITAKEILKTRARINRLLAEECKQPIEKVEEDATRDYWMTSNEALEYGLITKIIETASDLKIK
ncbi:MAG: ATP-dependent Clp protease proteolytic subunit [Oligoflexales bacterium]